MDSPASRLCISCGLCCNGSIYDHARLETAEATAVAAFGGVVDDSDQDPLLPLPCRLFEGMRCTIYHSRPGACRRFRCEVLRKLEDGIIDDAEAAAAVATAKELAREARRHMRAGETMADARRSWLAWSFNPAEAPGRDQPMPFHRAMLAFNRYLDRHFRKPHQVLVVGVDDAAEAIREEA